MWIREREFDAELESAAQLAGLETALLRAIVGKESSYNPRAYRAEPAIGDASRGLGQLLEATARGLNYLGELGENRPSVIAQGKFELTGLWQPAVNLRFAAKLLAENLARARPLADSGNTALEVAISAYNAGFSKERPGDAKRNAQGKITNFDAYVAPVLRYRDYFLELARKELADDVSGGSSSSASAPPPYGRAPVSLLWVLLLVGLVGVLYAGSR